MSIALSSHSLSTGTYLFLLKEIEKKLPKLLITEEWESLDVDYHPPRVERVWLQYKDLRICLHRIHPADSSDILFHRHPWPSAMKVLQGTYEMSVGFGATEITPPVAATLLLNTGSYYEMIHPDGWHSVNPKDGSTYSLMISGLPWPGREQKSGLLLKPLSQEAKEEILDFFRGQYPEKKCF